MCQPLEGSLANKRLIVSESSFTFQDIVDVSNEDFPQLKEKIMVGKPGAGARRLQGISILDNSKTEELLNFKLISFKQSVGDTVT